MQLGARAHSIDATPREELIKAGLRDSFLIRALTGDLRRHGLSYVRVGVWCLL
jgi:hypothetical protein